jgi:hypothetical protein
VRCFIKAALENSGGLNSVTALRKNDNERATVFHCVRLFDPERRLVREPPRQCLGPIWRVTNEGESGFGKVNNRVKVADRRPQGILGGIVVGCLFKGRGKAWPMEGHYRFPCLFSKRSNQALRPGPPPKPLSN